tara:strand:- start:9 stop:749 length:741 start_codon:yes stop_codon:yes gene_type:complete
MLSTRIRIILVLIIVLCNCLIYRENYENEEKDITVVICNYARPDNVEKIIKELINNSYIDEIIVTHGKAETYRDFEGAKNIKNYEINSKYGGTQRFFAALESSNEKIIFLDDDHIPSESLIMDMRKLSNEDPDQIYGPYKRRCLKTGYSYNSTKDNYNVILTGLVMTSKNVVNSYMKNFDKYSETLEKTHGNGEDLTFNHSFIDNYGKKPYYIEGAKYEVLDDQSESYSGRPDHKEKRDFICKKFF